jgi:hypothetical protein
VRPDIADVRLADRVFAPHYAEALRRTLVADTALRVDRGSGSERLAAMRSGDAFDLLDLTGGTAWGIAVSSGLVGYVDADALGAASGT